MKAKREYRRRPDTEVQVLDALVDRSEDGMTVFELRSHVEAGIDELEDALANLKRDGLIEATMRNGRTLIKPDTKVVPDPEEEPDEPSFVDKIIERLPL
ncbi:MULTISPECIES: DUF6432 family protein [unclassified Haladaptatus]|uniref:DUF6432 family protein n=1 Tax=unclassified Haladaptatus TaxID=2622732 RepID=UPI0007B4C87C|nr:MULTISPECIES: DUF6432 family protein [unclassified Haladaptatus]KZN24645.1 hypothetical protein A4G99_09865 [Haladaptatus sp. R4]MCO8244656.1 DUF6432 family protein [Haladaptatus sp. AB643]MCO8253722.1 DUF6432 family protein [Haladaptatus sp. AB618]